MEIPGGGGSNVKPSAEMENPGGWGVKLGKTLRGGYGYFLEPHNNILLNSFFFKFRSCLHGGRVPWLTKLPWEG